MWLFIIAIVIATIVSMRRDAKIHKKHKRAAELARKREARGGGFFSVDPDNK